MHLRTDGRPATALDRICPHVWSRKCPTESSALDRVSRLLSQELCLPNLPANRIPYKGCRENRDEYSRKRVSAVGMGAPSRRLTQGGKVSWEFSTLRDRENQWSFDGAVTLKVFDVLIVVCSDHLLHHEGVG